jgi:hypothetical protein
MSTLLCQGYVLALVLVLTACGVPALTPTATSLQPTVTLTLTPLSLPTSSQVSSGILLESSYTTVITEADASQLGAQPDNVGTWTLMLDAASTFSLSLEQTLIASGSYQVIDDQIVFTVENICTGCRCGNNVGTYQWKFDGMQLAFTKVDSDCLDEVLVLTSHPWIKQQ